ncbi:MAG: hypothetical protein IH983_03180 [Planctomycetes bacterium]|nr:hypothetical protein [Planctomycetota bacterium]
MARILTLMAVAAILSFCAVGCGNTDPVTTMEYGVKADPDHPQGVDHPKGEDPSKGADHPEGADHPKG